MTITLIAAAAENNALGKDNQMVWHLPDDFKRFKKLTTGHPIIMGRKTLESMNGPLPNRTNIIITRQKDYTYDELLRWRKANWILTIPVFAVKLLYYLGKFINSTFLKENTVKLISDNIFPSEKIRSYIDLPATMNDAQFGND